MELDMVEFMGHAGNLSMELDMVEFMGQEICLEFMHRTSKFAHDICMNY